MPGRRATRAQRKRHEEAADWLLRNREAGQPAAEQVAFRNWLDQDAENGRAYRAAELLMGEARNAIASDPALRALEMSRPGRSRPVAGLVLVAVLAGGAFLALDGPMRLRADAISGSGEMPVVTLADGSTLQLNASSAVAYDYTSERRIVRLLRGQAYFEVARDPARPFMVEADDTRVTALGTAFDVRLGDGRTDVTVTHSAVLAAFADGRRAPLRISQGEQAELDHSTGQGVVRSSDAVTALAWRRGQLVVDNAPLAFVVEEMNRHFAGRIIIASRALSQRRVSGTLLVSDTQASLDYLERALRLTVNKLGPFVVVR